MLKRFCFMSLALCVFFNPPAWPAGTSLSDDEMLETIQKKSFEYFVKERNANTGLIPDRANNFQRGATPSTASIAACGFALTAFPIGVEHGWIDKSVAYEMTRQMLFLFLHKIPQEHGFFYHFLKMNSGERASRSEISPIDTALFLAGALFAAEYYDRPELRDLADKIYKRVDFPWMLHGGETLALSWSPESGFNRRRWDNYDEAMILYLLAIGSPEHSIPSSSWKAVARPVGSYRNYRLIQMPPLFTHQYSHIWIDFKDKNDGFADYFKNSVNATLANRSFCIDQAAKFPGYGPNSWGLTASDGPFGYKAYGAPPGWATHDGTIAPTACGASIVFTPQESIACLRHFYEDFGDKLWGQYGFSDSFNKSKDWVSQDALAIDQGPIVAMIENYRTGLVWKTMAKNPYLQEAMKKVGFKPGTIELPWPDPPVYEVHRVYGGISVDGYLKDWPNTVPAIILDRKSRESGNFKNDNDVKSEVRFAWNQEALYFSAKVTDDSLILQKFGANIWRDDTFEIFINPQGDGLIWGSERDFQINFRPEKNGDNCLVWSYFQGGEDPRDRKGVAARSFVYDNGYVIEGSIPWTYLDVLPHEGFELRASPAIHDADRDGSERKLQWFFRNEEAEKRFVLGKLILTRD